MVLQARGLAVKAYDHSRENAMLNTREWNPVHYAIYFQQYLTLKMLGGELSGVAPGGLGADLKAAMGHCFTVNEFSEDRQFEEAIGNHSSEGHLYGIMLAILARNLPVFKYLYEEAHIQFNESDVLRMLRLSMSAHWPQGFLFVVNSPTTAAIFCYGSLDFKEEFVRFSLNECEGLVSKGLPTNKKGAPSQTDEDVTKEVKDRMTEHPYSCISWLYFDPIHKDLKNQRYIKRLLEATSFTLDTLEVLAAANQLDRILKKCDKPRINFDFLNRGGISEDEHANAQEGGMEQ